MVKGSAIGTDVTTTTALRFRNRQLSAFHHVVAQILDRGGATEEVYLLPTYFDHLIILFLLLFLQCIDCLIDWCLMPTLAIFQLYRRVTKFDD